MRDETKETKPHHSKLHYATNSNLPKFTRMRIVNCRSISRPEFNAVFRFSKLARFASQYSRLVAAACRDARRTLEGNEARRCDARRDKPRQLNVSKCEDYKAK